LLKLTAFPDSQPKISTHRDVAAWCLILALSICYLAVSLAALSTGGPLWLWFNVDPDYFYLFDALNIVNLTTPGQVYHPGTTVQWLGALILKAANPLTGAEAITGQVLADPEPHLRLIASTFVVFNTLGVVALGAVGYRVFGDLLAVAVLGMAPFISMVVLKNSYHVKPEGLLLLTVLALAVVSVLSLKPGLLERRRRRFAVAFGVIAGFGVATKITALPVFLLPLLVLGEGRAIVLYGIAALAALLLFTLPALGAYDVFFAWMATVSQGTGAYGAGPAGVVDWAAYPKSVFHLFKRPAFHVVFVLSVLTLVLAAWRRRQERPLPAPEVRLLAGIALAQFVHVLLVAKQPSAHYLIPSFSLITLAFVLVWRLAVAWLAEGGSGERVLRTGVAMILVALIAGQGYGVFKLFRELSEGRSIALTIDDGHFGNCARIYAATASSKSFALLNGDYITGSRFAEQLAGLGPANDYWLEQSWHDSPLVFRGWRGPQNLSRVLERYPCAVFRSSRWITVEQALREIIPDLKFDATCSTRDETIVTVSVDCSGRVLH
jgi:hypothetical protein